MFKELFDAILRVFFGHNAVDNVADLKKSHEKAVKSRQEVEEILRNNSK